MTYYRADEGKKVHWDRCTEVPSVEIGNSFELTSIEKPANINHDGVHEMFKGTL
jgi:hypothetical protein